MKSVLLIVVFLSSFFLIGCGESAPDLSDEKNSEPTTSITEAEGAASNTNTEVEERPAGIINPLEEADAIVADINQNIDSYTKTSSEKTVKEVNVCQQTTYTSANGTQKKVVSDCYDGNRMTRLATAYYLNDQPLYLELKVETLNVSPSNLEAFDESKTKVEEYSFYLKDSQLDEYLKILDKDGEVVNTLDENTKEDIALISATLK